MTTPTNPPVEPTEDEKQLQERYNDPKVVVDKLRDAVFNPGSNKVAHRAALASINESVPEFFMDFAFALGAYVNNQAGEVDDETLDALTVLMENEGKAARSAALDAGADVIGGALNDTGIMLRLQGKMKWHAPGAEGDDTDTGSF